MKRVLVGLAAAGMLAAGCAPATATRPAPPVGEDSYDQVKALAELGWFDVAERTIARMPDLSKERPLARAYLALRRAETQPDPARKYALSKQALEHLESYHMIPPLDRRLDGEATVIEAPIWLSMLRACEARAADPRTPAQERPGLAGQIAAFRAGLPAKLTAAIERAEAAYGEALARHRAVGSAESEGAKFRAFDTYVRITQRYLNELFRQAEAHDPGSAEQKAAGQRIVAFVAGWFENQGEREPLDDDTAGVRMYMDYAKGRGYAFLGDPAAAGKEFDKAIEIEVVAFEAGPAREYATAIKTRCIYYKARAWADKAKVSKAEADWHKALQSHWHEIFAGGAGTDPVLAIRARILKGECHGKVSQFTSAMDDLKRALDEIDKAEKAGTLRPEVCQSLRWEAYPAMVEPLTIRRERGLETEVSPEVLVQAGLLSYRREKYDDAIVWLREAVARARRPDIAGDWARRLVVEGEPMAWYLMGNAYHRMGNELEAQQAYEACLTAFWGADGKAIPERFRRENPALIEQLRARVLIPCARNGRIAAVEEYQANPSKFNDERLERWLEWQTVDIEVDLEPPYYRARMIFEGARESARRAVELERAGRAEDARTKRAEAVRRFENAEMKFVSISEDSPIREEATYGAGMCCYEALAVLSGKDRTEAERKSAAECAERALKHFADYRKFIKDHPPRVRTSDPVAAKEERREIEDRRAKRLATIDLTEPFIYFEIKEYTKALEAAEKLRERQDLDAAQQEGLHNLLFKCHVEIGLAEKDQAKAMEHFKAAEKEMLWFKERAEKAQGTDRVRLQGICESQERLLTAITVMP